MRIQTLVAWLRLSAQTNLSLGWRFGAFLTSLSFFAIRASQNFCPTLASFSALKIQRRNGFAWRFLKIDYACSVRLVTWEVFDQKFWIFGFSRYSAEVDEIISSLLGDATWESVLTCVCTAPVHCACPELQARSRPGFSRVNASVSASNSHSHHGLVCCFCFSTEVPSTSVSSVLVLFVTVF